MAAPITKLQRWLDLVAYLAGRRYPVSVEDLREHIPAYAVDRDASDTEKESVRRKFERDKDELRGLGIPIETVEFSVNRGDEHQQGYRLARKDFHLPYLKLLADAQSPDTSTSPETPRSAGTSPASASVFEIHEKEAGAALGGLRDIASLPSYPLASQARSAFRKLAFDLEPEAVQDSPVLFAQDPEAVETQQALATLSRAVLARKRTTFQYHGMHRDSQAQRTVQPFGLLFQHGRWYLVGHDEDRAAVRMFRVGRMTDIEVNASKPGTPDFGVPEDFRLADYGGRKAWELGDDDNGAVEATVWFRFPRSLWAERNRHGDLIAEETDGAQLRRFRVHRQDPFLRWVLSLAPDAHIESPEDLRRAFQALAASVLRRHGTEDGEVDHD